MTIAVLLIAIYIVTILECSSATDTLGCYNIDQTKISVSGFSSGGYFAVQFHVAYSSTIMGAGIVAGGPYYCAEGHIANTRLKCMRGTSPLDINRFVQQVKAYSRENKIDDPRELKGSHIYLYSGSKDTVVYSNVVKALERFYIHFVNPSNIASVYNIPSQHAIVTDNYGNLCSTFGSPYINNCNYSTAYHILKHIYSTDIKLPTPGSHMIKDNLYEFRQSEFFTNSTMDNTGYIYVPTGCQRNTTKCKLHFVFHGFRQGREYVDKEFVLNAKYNEVAEDNDIIIVYPQVHRHDLDNPNGSWDWWGYTGVDYATKHGPQMSGVMKILNKLSTC